ncbi:MAG: hypothetical protein L3J36_14930 [Rhodobacteraceae bacterium]|nr:hypothetical protein [Paracoccaceae bacterium]
MTFTKLGRILAVTAIVLGVFRITMAVIAINSVDPVGAARAFLGSKSTGYYIDQGIYSVVFGIVVGVLTDISKSLISFREANLQDGSE